MNTKDISTLIDTPCVIYDVSRLVKRAVAPAPTGIDRIDLQIGMFLREAFGGNFMTVMRSGDTACLLSERERDTLLSFLYRRWNRGEMTANDFKSPWLTARRLGARMKSRKSLAASMKKAMAGKKGTYVCCSHAGLATVSGLLPWLAKTLDLRSLIYIHDIIPLDFPEYSRPSMVQRFRRLLEQFAQLDAVYVVNSRYTAERLQWWLMQHGHSPAHTHLLPPVIDWIPADLPPLSSVQGASDTIPYFVAIGTIEPRKNHLLLLNVWREMVFSGEQQIPHLHIIGKRGWENENIIDMLDRCEAIKPYVHEHGTMMPRKMYALLRGSRALLMPSYAEGLGLPVLEACAIGTRVVASDIPVFREVLQKQNELISPLDGIAWQNRVLDLAS